ncbi:BgTH12-02436 [Blumeria graminis f. sp. triticale]|uniref:Pre-mRNA-splicing factor n=1 Tax=Blumeria graminis f. sp. triticale TaxID=1689686 RepID=A0A9W4D1G7_BLUGR|nr:BgTH12-02436 [Blumeria graminis f. sp. triticale]
MALSTNNTRQRTADVYNTKSLHESSNPFSATANKFWLKSTKVKITAEVLKANIWDFLEKEDFAFKFLLDLENLQILEDYLWPGFTEDASNIHVLLIVLLSNVRAREHLPVWDTFYDKKSDFSSLFRRIISLSLDTSLSSTVRIHVLSFIINSFQSLEREIVRKECAPLVSISIWHNLSCDRKREQKLDQNIQVRKAWRASIKRYDAADAATKSRLRIERSWLLTLVFDFLRQLYDAGCKPSNIRYCERFVELLADLQSQLPTRRYVNTMLQDLNIIPAIRNSPVFNQEQNGLLRDLLALLKHYTNFPIDDYTGVHYGLEGAYERHCSSLAMLQRTAFRNFRDKLTVLALSNYGSIGNQDELRSHVETLSDEELAQLCELLQIRTQYPASTGILLSRELLIEILLSVHEKQKTFHESAQELSILPTEITLFDPSLLRNDHYNGSQPLAIPKLNLQYLTVGDFLSRSLILHRCECFYEIRKHIEDTIKQLRPSASQNGQTNFEGSSKMALQIPKPVILEVSPPLVGQDMPSKVLAEIILDTSRMSDDTRRDWSSLRIDDVVFLLSVQILGNSTPTDVEMTSEPQQPGLRYLRAAEVIHVLDEKGRQLNDQNHENGYFRSRIKKLQVKLDASAYREDMELVSTGKPNIYESLNVIVRRRGRENNFKPILESIQNLTLSDVPLATWLHDIFLGYGDPSGASFRCLGNRIKKIDYRDTFLDRQHLIESLAGKALNISNDLVEDIRPPYVLEFENTETKDPIEPTKKRRRITKPPHQNGALSVRVSTYQPMNTGPYPTDSSKLNKIRFTPTQAEAIISGSQPGLTVIVGPPGTGKTDVVTQIINIIYHNFPEQRTLLIAHSNQALNTLFQKIVALDIDQRHLLRLGHADDLDTESNFSKHGRVESFLDNRESYLQEVDRLAANFGAPGAHGSSAEAAGYFNLVYVEPAWKIFQQLASSVDTSAESLIQAFPFHHYFSNAPQPLFPQGSCRETILNIANGCYFHISKIFSELADIRPFEVLRRDRDKANYLLTNEARIIAMTSTYAAIRRGEIVSLGFHYDNVVMEEAAQITEIENFIPLALQLPKNGKMPLQRVVLCGDHFQNSPVIQNLAFRQYANLEQSLFYRLIRLGVPTINLDQQGRARPSIASLYSWRYQELGNLSSVLAATEFQIANAGFKFDYQFINVVDYQGRGESEPSPHLIQNQGEAEYAVAIYQYMRLLGYPAPSISILTTYSGQRELIKELLSIHCARNPIFNLPKIVTTVDKYQGEQNDYVILSLTRTSRVGYLRDIRRLTVALSRARLGLYILGRREIFESCSELRKAFDIIFQRPDKLMLVTGEMWPSQRILADEISSVVSGETVMESVDQFTEHVKNMIEFKTGQDHFSSNYLGESGDKENIMS